MILRARVPEFCLISARAGSTYQDCVVDVGPHFAENIARAFNLYLGIDTRGDQQM